jgi:hypothetical protein
VLNSYMRRRLGACELAVAGMKASEGSVGICTLEKEVHTGKLVHGAS